jgi:hypothetical protein
MPDFQRLTKLIVKHALGEGRMWKGFWPRQLRDALGRTGKTQPTGVERHVVEGWVVNLGGGQPLAPAVRRPFSRRRLPLA